MRCFRTANSLFELVVNHVRLIIAAEVQVTLFDYRPAGESANRSRARP
jgi:hypothetical protein